MHEIPHEFLTHEIIALTIGMQASFLLGVLVGWLTWGRK